MQGSSSYSEYDVARQEIERQRMRAAMSPVPVGGIDFDVDPRVDTSTGVYNVTPGGAHP